MFKEIIKEVKWGDATLTLKTGKVARQAEGAVLVCMGDTVILCTAVSAKEVKPGVAFFPLTVHYREMAYAGGKIPGGFRKREGQPSEKEILVSRLIDRPIRPLFHPAFFNETQVICTVLSHDPKYCSEILALVGASAAIALSGIPCMDIIAASRVGYIDGEFVLNPSYEMIANSKLDLIVAGTDTSVMMVESEAHELSETKMLEALEFGHKNMQPVIKLIEEFAKEAGKPKWELPELGIENLVAEISKDYSKAIVEAFKVTDKQQRYHRMSEIFAPIEAKHEEEYGHLKLEIAFAEVKAKVVRNSLLETKIRIDSRKPDQIRQIVSETGILPRTHGSSLFTRGETQALVSTTLGTGQDEQMYENLDAEGKERFLLHYIFPPYSVNETTPFRAPGRREIGHGKLAWRAINPVLPSKEEFPYTVRVVSEITESNGSSSMATVCGASMSMMEAGVPLKSPVAGIAMGLIKEGKDFVVLSDIMADEDHLGDMDFKVAGTENGITALQMDIKVAGINFEIMKIALSQAKEGRIHILGKMSESITEHKVVLSEHAPQIVKLKIDKDKIRELIGPGGKVIKEICEVSGAKIDISDDGIVQVSAVGKDKIEIALARIKAITFEPEVGSILDGTILKILESGAFVGIPGGKDGYLHISEISTQRVASIDDHLKVGQAVKVKIIGSEKGKIKVSMKALLGAKEPEEATPASSVSDSNSDSHSEKKEGSEKKKEVRDHKKPQKTYEKRRETPIESKVEAATTSQRKYFN